jgi:integrase
MSSRRPQGEGSVYRLPDGRWRGAVDLGWHEGKRRRKYITRSTQAEVVRELRRLTAAAEEGRLAVTRAPTLGQWMERYLDEVAASSVRPSSLRRYRQELRLYVVPALGKVPLDKLKPSQVSDFYRSQLLHLSPGSVRRLHALLRRSLGVAVRWQLIPWNPVTAVDPPSLTPVEVHPFDARETRLFLAAASGDRFLARWLIAVLLGLRQGEVLGLAWRDVDLDQRVLTVRQALQYRPGDGFHLVPPKTARSRRTVPLPDAVVDALKLRREQQEADRQAAGVEFWEDWGLVFTTRLGTPLSPRNDYREFRRLVDAAGLRPVRLHDLRHTAASLMLAQGVNPRVVMELLGHSQISVTMNTYSHVAPASSREAVARVEGLLFDGHSEVE